MRERLWEIAWTALFSVSALIAVYATARGLYKTTHLIWWEDLSYFSFDETVLMMVVGLVGFVISFGVLRFVPPEVVTPDEYFRVYRYLLVYLLTGVYEAWLIVGEGYTHGLALLVGGKMRDLLEFWLVWVVAIHIFRRVMEWREWRNSAAPVR